MSQYYRDRATILQQQQPNKLQHIVTCCNTGPKPPKNGKHNRSYASQDILGELENTKMQGVASQLGNHSGQPQINCHTTKRSIYRHTSETTTSTATISTNNTPTKQCSFLQISLRFGYKTHSTCSRAWGRLQKRPAAKEFIAFAALVLKILDQTMSRLSASNHATIYLSLSLPIYLKISTTPS